MSNIRLRILSGVSKSRFLTYLDKSTSPFANPRNSLIRLTLRKIRVLVEYAIKSIIYFRDIEAAKKHNKKFPLLSEKKFAIVLGNGPSLGKLNIRNVATAQSQGALDVIVINNFLSSSLFKEGLLPNTFVLSDPVDSPVFDQFGNWAKLVSLEPDFRIAVPMEWSRSALDKFPSLAENLYFFDDRSLEGWTKNVYSTQARGYSQVTAYKALALACTKQFKKIAILGIDNTLHHTLRVDKRNAIWQHSNHAEGVGKSELNDSHLYFNGVADYFYFLSGLFLSLKLNFGKFPIVNLDEDSLVDAFTKQDAEINALHLVHLKA